MKSALQDGAHLLLYAPLSQATAGMAGKKKEGVLRAWHTLAWTSRICTRPVRREVSTPGAGETCSLPTLDPRGRGRNMAVAAMTRPGWRGRVPRRAFRVSAATPALPAHGRARHGASRSKGDRTLLRCRKSLRPRSPPVSGCVAFASCRYRSRICFADASGGTPSASQAEEEPRWLQCVRTAWTRRRAKRDAPLRAV